MQKLTVSTQNNILAKHDLNNLYKFLLSKPDNENKCVELYFRFTNLGLKSNLKLPLRLKFLPLYVKHVLSDLDFGPIDRVIRKFRKQVVLNHLGTSTDYVLLDAGCGRQATLGWNIKDKCKQYIGIDRDIPQLEILNLKFIKGSVEDIMPLIENESIDVIAALALIEHLDKPSDFVKECMRVLKPGGKIILTTPPPISAPILELISKLNIINGEEIDEHKGYFDLQSLGDLLTDNGFKVTEAKKFLFGFNCFIVGQKPTG